MDNRDKDKLAEQSATATPLVDDVKPAKSNDALKQRTRRNRAIALMIFVFVALIYLVTVLRLGASIA